MVRQVLGGALAALLVISDRIAFVALAIAVVAAVKIVATVQAPRAGPAEAARAIMRVKL
jgi:hypothetical protein